MKHFGKTDVILRTYDIRKQRKDFPIKNGAQESPSPQL